MRRERIFGLIIVCAIAFVLIFSLIRVTAPLPNFSGGGNSISLIRLEGIIGGDVLTGQSISEDDVKTLLEEVKESSTKALLIRIDSPGGDVTTTEEIYNLLLRFKKETGRKVYVSMGGYGASGAYYISCAADKIFAEPSTITGSIGVIMEFLDYSELLSKIGIKETVIKSDIYKDMGSSIRDMTDAEKQMFQSIIDEAYERFLSVVSENRHIEMNKLKDVSRGQIFTGLQANERGLIDGVGSLEDTIDILAKDVGIEGKPVIVEHKIEQSLFSILFNLSQVPEVEILKGLEPFKVQYILRIGY